MVTTLQQALTSCTDASLVGHLWGLKKRENVALPQWIEMLLERIQHQESARCVWERLATWQERVTLWHSVSKTARRGIQRGRLLTKTELPREEFDAALSSLTEQLLLVEELLPAKEVQTHAASTQRLAQHGMESTLFPFGEQVESLYQTGRELFLSGAQRTYMSLSKLHQSRTETDLWRMIHHYRLDSTGLQRESELRVAMIEALADPTIVRASLPRLDTSIMEVYSWILGQGGQAPAQTLRTHFSLDDGAFFSLLERLSSYGLAFDTLSPDVPGLRLLFVPQELSEGLRRGGVTATREEKPLVPLAVSPVVIDEGQPVLVGDLAVVVNAVYQGRVELTREGTVVKQRSTIAKVQSLLRGRDRPGIPLANCYLDMLFETAERLHLIQRVHAPFAMQSLKPYYEPDPWLSTWARLSLKEQTRHLLSWYRSSPHWRDTCGNDFRQWDSISWEPQTARALLISSLQECVPGVWYRIDDLLHTIWKGEPYALRPAFASRVQEGLHPTAVLKAKWSHCEGAVLRDILTSTLWELGLVSLGYTQGTDRGTLESYDAFLVTELGASALDLVSSPGGDASPVKSDALVLLPTGEALLREYDTVMLYRMLPYVEIRQVDRAIHMAFTRASVIQGIDQGHLLEDLLEMLEANWQRPPQNVLYMIKEWARGYTLAELSHVLLFSLSSEDRARQITHSPRWRAWGLRQLTPTIIAAPAHVHLGELRKALEAEGIVVHVGRDVLPFPPLNMPQPGEPSDAAKTHGVQEERRRSLK